MGRPSRSLPHAPVPIDERFSPNALGSRWRVYYLIQTLLIMCWSHTEMSLIDSDLIKFGLNISIL